MIHIITPCSRPDNLKVIAKSIPAECNWTVCLDASVTEVPVVTGATIIKSPYTGNSGNQVRNYALDSIEAKDSDWIYFLDDDNIVHPDWFKEVSTNTEKDKMLVWGQILKKGNIRLEATSAPCIGNIDVSSFMVPWRILKNIRFHPSAYAADGILATKVFKLHGCHVIDKYLCYYNFLR